MTYFILGEEKWSDLDSTQRYNIIVELLSRRLSNMEIASKLHTNKEYISSFCRYHNLKQNSFQGAQEGNKNAEVDGLGRNTIKRLTKKVLQETGRNLDICERCGGRDPFRLGLARHHKDRNRLNNNPENIEVLCQSCHVQEHLQDRRRDEYGRWK